MFDNKKEQYWTYVMIVMVCVLCFGVGAKFTYTDAQNKATLWAQEFLDDFNERTPSVNHYDIFNMSAGNYSLQNSNSNMDNESYIVGE